MPETVESDHQNPRKEIYGAIMKVTEQSDANDILADNLKLACETMA